MQARLFVMHDEALRKAFGACLKALRKQKNRAQKELAALVEIHFQQLNKHESGLSFSPYRVSMKISLLKFQMALTPLMKRSMR
jgi:transcriptional regulator with XRE-family HTH domain